MGRPTVPFVALSLFLARSWACPLHTGTSAVAAPTATPIRSDPVGFPVADSPVGNPVRNPVVANPAAEAVDPSASYTANPNIGPGGSNFKDSAHFRVYNAADTAADQSLAMLEAAHDCFVTTLGWRSSGLSFNDASDSGALTKTNVYSLGSLPGAAGVMQSDATTGMAFLEVQQDYVTTPGVVIHEFGHGLHYHQRTWVHQGRTGAWWETFANWFADTVQTSDLCAAAREAHGLDGASTTQVALTKIISDSYQVLVDGTPNTANYYEAWPFLTFLTNNPANIRGLGNDTLHQMMLQYEPDSNETPLHTLQRVAGTGTTVAKIVGSYWAHMAYVDIGHPGAREAFVAQRRQLNYDNVDGSGSSYTVKAGRKPMYMGANIIPLAASGGTVSVQVTAQAAYTATLAVSGNNGASRYVDVVDGAGSVELANGEEVSLVIANTPEELVLYDAFSLTSDVTTGLDYSFTLTGATVEAV
ncbi:hypothetical protein HJFPF1_12052 [Paramyrothecium foliicola]|nr:hypothetical protein HJFPF1_12052 [Paramyrothecium foliicola]